MVLEIFVGLDHNDASYVTIIKIPSPLIKQFVMRRLQDNTPNNPESKKTSANILEQDEWFKVNSIQQSERKNCSAFIFLSCYSSNPFLMMTMTNE